MKTCAFFVPGTPCAKGSMRGFVLHRTRRVRLVPDNKPKLLLWTSIVRKFASEVWNEPPTRDAVIVRLDVWFPRPKSHYGTGRNAGVLKASAPASHRQKPDWDKVVRGILDALTDVVYRDDCQVAGTPGLKMWASEECPPGVRVCICTMTESEFARREVAFWAEREGRNFEPPGLPAAAESGMTE